jgi:acetyl esterase
MGRLTRLSLGILPRPQSPDRQDANAMTIDPYYDALRAAQADTEKAALLMSPELLAKLAPQSVPHPAYVAPQLTPLEDVVDGPEDKVRVRVYRPNGVQADGPLPLIMWLHGGGWVEFGHDTPGGDNEAIEVCQRLGAVVVSPDYRLAVEGVWYPAPIDDIVAAWHWALDNCSAWGASAERTALGGGSAGANLAAGAALRLRDEGGPLPTALILNVPPLHPYLPALTPQEREELHVSSDEAERIWRMGLRLGFENYMGCSADEAPIYAAPGIADPTGLPPTMLIACEYDILRASARVYAEALAKAGVKHKYVLYRGVGHGHTVAPWLPAAQQTYDDMAKWLADA